MVMPLADQGFLLLVFRHVNTEKLGSNFRLTTLETNAFASLTGGSNLAGAEQFRHEKSGPSGPLFTWPKTFVTDPPVSSTFEPLGVFPVLPQLCNCSAVICPYSVLLVFSLFCSSYANPWLPWLPEQLLNEWDSLPT